MAKGYNKAKTFDKIYWLLESKSIKDRACVFLSHKKEDKSECIKEAEIDYYLDELDNDLQQAVAQRNPELITESIKKGIRESTHMLVVVSEKTYKSQWVPFEIGYGHSAILDKGLDEGIKENKIKLSVLTLKDISEKNLPDYLQVAFIIRGTKSLNDYISKITNRLEKSLITETKLFSNTKINHPLDNVLNYRL
jgi:hypothetical protein